MVSAISWTSPRTWVASEVVTAALLNTHLRDNQKAIGDPWTAYTPAWTSSGTAPAIGNGTVVGHYIDAGAFTVFRAVLTMGSTTTFGTGTYSLSLPVTAAGAGRTRVDGLARDDSAANDWPAAGVIVNGSTAVSLRTWPATAGIALVVLTPSVPFTWANLDSLTISGIYES